MHYRAQNQSWLHQAEVLGQDAGPCEKEVALAVMLSLGHGPGGAQGAEQLCIPLRWGWTSAGCLS